MRRRDALQLAGPLAVAGLAGCLTEARRDEPGASGGEDAPTATPTPGSEGTDTPGSASDDGGGHEDEDTPVPGASPELVDSTFEVRSQGPSLDESAARVEFGEGVTVSGTIRGRNGCYTAELDDAAGGRGGLRVLVRAYDASDADGVCTQEMVDLEYEATFEFEGSLPDRVVVEHDSGSEFRTVADVER